ncbi:LL-diaminopimelate aminotransferase [Alicyclobacillus cellulosilyticus]|uniref:LL-diaminopimelate aminotransferase n=1 Tax=Alicyclobacillus cellulosilyticus TaxID=1003997 RepID=A0A917KC44_9BACL|nr:aminotransferase class I/II-fold pyridoxal phosphate-dependent enzyme [Alicyclobacillus cellulosilyticus]GGJ05596.1 LL-diaminopimelate aminotransferase [Alicyclobacillus cellulosilyticus]
MAEVTITRPAARKAQKLAGLAPYVFAQLDERVYRLREQGAADIVDLGKADPDQATPAAVVRRLQETAADPENHHYPAFRGSLFFREAVARFYRRRFGVMLDPEREVLALIGSKEGLFHISLAYLDAGDLAVIPDPAFPAYDDGVWFAGGRAVRVPLRRHLGWLPDLDAVPADIWRRTKLLFLNYPNNPTGVLAPRSFLERVVDLARRYAFLICYDHAYSEITYDGRVSPSILEVPGAKDVAVEFMTFSKTFNMAGWRLGAAVGCAEAIESLLVVQSHINSGIFAPIQFAGATALDEVWPSPFAAALRAEYQRRRDYAVQSLRRIGWHVDPPQGAVYLWLPVPAGTDGETFAERLLETYRVVVAPGSAFGRTGKHHVRISLTTAYENVVKGIDRLAECLAKAGEPPWPDARPEPPIW